jgi:hypothetical protein
VLAVAAAGLLVAGLAACGSASSGPWGGVSAPASAPVPAPASTGLPEPSNAWQLAAYTNPDGYKVSDRLIFGVPLHYAIPHSSSTATASSPSPRTCPRGST